jgi:hypothetical protein
MVDDGTPCAPSSFCRQCLPSFLPHSLRISHCALWSVTPYCKSVATCHGGHAHPRFPRLHSIDFTLKPIETGFGRRRRRQYTSLPTVHQRRSTRLMVPIKSTHTIGWNILNGWLVEELEGVKLVYSKQREFYPR